MILQITASEIPAEKILYSMSGNLLYLPLRNPDNVAVYLVAELHSNLEGI